MFCFVFSLKPREDRNVCSAASENDLEPGKRKNIDRIKVSTISEAAEIGHRSAGSPEVAVEVEQVKAGASQEESNKKNRQSIPVKATTFNEKKVVGIVEPRVVVKASKETKKLESCDDEKTTQLIRELPQTFREALLEKGASDLIHLSTTCSSKQNSFGWKKVFKTESEMKQQHLTDQISPPGGAALDDKSKRKKNILFCRDRRNLSRKQPSNVAGLRFGSNEFKSTQSNEMKYTQLASSSTSSRTDRFCERGQNKQVRLMRKSQKTSCHSHPESSSYKNVCCENCNSVENENGFGCSMSNSELTNEKKRKRSELLSQREADGDNNNCFCCGGNSITIPDTFERERRRFDKNQDDVVGSRPRNDQNSDIDDEAFQTCSELSKKRFKRVVKKKSEKFFPASTTTTVLNENGMENNCFKGNANEKREVNGGGISSSSSTSESNCLEVVAKKNNLESLKKEEEVRRRRNSWSSSTSNDLSEDDEDEEDDDDEEEEENGHFQNRIFFGKTNFNHSKVDDRWIYCQERGCSFWTRKPERMTRHFKCHVTDQKHYQCPDCPLRFYSLAKMLKHDRKVHTGVKDYECRVCDAEVTDIQIHMRVSP